jgi:hypothetical protein
VRAERKRGAEGSKAKLAKGRHRKLSPRQERTVLSWFTQSARRFGFFTELRTAPRVASLIKKKWNIDFHPRYLNHWLAQRLRSFFATSMLQAGANIDVVRQWGGWKSLDTMLRYLADVDQTSSVKVMDEAAKRLASA